MPIDSSKLRKVYATLQQGGYEQDYDTFARGFAGNDHYANRKKVYDLLSANGAQVGDSYEDFMQRMQVASTPTPQKPTTATAQMSTPAPSTAPAKPQPKKNQPLTPAERQAMIDQVQQMQYQTNASLQRTKNRMDFAKANTGLNVPHVTLGDKNSGVKLGQNSKVVAKKPHLNPKSGKMERTYITESGNEYADRANADLEQNIIDEEARQPLGLNMNDQQVSAAQKPANAAVAALWKEAEAKYAADRNKNAEDVYGGNPWLHGGREMHIVDAATNSHKNEASRLTRFDLQKMMDNAWGRVGKQMTASCYTQLKKQYPTATEQQLQNSASTMARRLSDNAVYKYAVAKNTPKSTLEFFAKTAADMNLLRTISKGLARSEAGTTGDMAAYEQAMSDYGKNHRWAQVGGTVTGMLFDPTTYISGGIGSFAGKTALNLGGRLVARKAATNVGARLFGNTLTGRVVAGVAGGAGNFGTYEGIKEGESQFLHGGHINPETGENEGYSEWDVLKSTLHGTVLGSVTGTVSPLLGNVADKWVKATSNTAGKVGIRAGELATSTIAEGTIFSIPEWINGNGDAMDVWTDNMAMMIGFKGQHMIKSATRVIAGLRPIANPKTMQERNQNRMSFVERLGRTMDAGPRKQWNANQNDIEFTNEEREELRRHGYGELADLFKLSRTPKRKPSKPQRKPQSTDGKVMYLDIPEADVEDLGKQAREQWLKQHPEFDGYEAMERLMQDPNVSQSARAKAYYILTGRQLPMGTITGYTTERDENGNIFVKSVTANGEVVTNKRFADEASAKKEQDKIMRQAELNSVDVGERYTEAKADNKVWEAAIEAIAPGADPETVKRNYQAAKQGDKDAIANYGQMVDAIDKFMEENKGMADAERPEAIRAAIKEDTGVDVDAAIKKEPSKRTDPEKAAVQDYIERLFPEQKAETEQPMSDDEAGASAIYDQSRLLWEKVEQGDADAKADVDAIVIRMKEAYDICNEAFGTDAEMRMAEMEENPWALANDPELTEDQQNAVLNYINAKAAMDGVQDASNDAMENKRREVAANVERHTHKDNGMVQPATMKVDDKPVYIVKGNVVPLPDGTGIDVRNSDQSIVICDAETGEYKFTSPDQIFNLGEPIDPQSELDEAYANIQAEHDAMLGSTENGESEPNSEESVQVAPGGVEYGVNDTFTLLDGAGATVHGEVQGVSEDGVEIRTDEPWNGRRVQVIPAAEFEEMVERISDADGNLVWEREYAGEADAAEEAPGNPAQQGGEPAQRQPEAQGVQREAEASALSRVPINEDTGEPMFEKADSETALDALGEVTGGSAENTAAIVNAQLEQAQKAVEALRKKRPTKKAAALKGSPMAMAEAQRAADAAYSSAMERYGAQVAEAEGTLDAWTKIHALMDGRKRAERERQEAERRERDAQAHDAAVAQVAEQKRVAAEKAREQAGVGAHAVNPKLKEKWDKAAKVEGNANAIPLADGSTLRGRYVLTEAGAASASHDISNAFEPTEGFPVDENGESVNDRDYKRDTDARRIVRDMARNYDGRALQPPVIVSKDGVVLSGNNRTMSGDLAAQQGTDGAYVDYLREFGLMYGFTPEQVDGMKHPRVVFVPDVELPYDAATFARFNAETQKRQGKDAQAVKLGKVVPDSVFSGIVGDISRYDRLSDYYADSKAVSAAISRLLGAGVINEMQLPEMRTGNALSAAGKELIENTLIGKVFQSSPDAVRQIIATPTLRQSVMMALGEIARNRTLAKSGYGLSQELGAAVGLVARARGAHPDIFKDGVPVSPFGRQQGLFDDEYGDSRVTDAIVLLLADILNSGKPSDLRKVLATYNHEAEAPAGGQMDMFSGKVETKEELLNRITEYFRNATPREQQAIVDAAVAERKKRAEAAAQAADGAGRGGGNQAETASENGSIRLRNDGRGRVEGHPNQRQGDLAETEVRNAENVGNRQKNNSEKANTDKITPVGESDFGFVYDQFKGDVQGAIQQLIKMQDGEALGALHHNEIGDIDLVWGKAGTRKSDGYGLAKLVKFHPEVLDNLQGILDGMRVTKRSENRVQLENDEYQAAVRLTWNGNEKLWLLTAFKKKETSEPTNSRTDVDSNLDGKSDDTAPRQSSDVSVRKDTEQSADLQGKGGKSSANEGEMPLSEQIEAASAEADTEPTEAQKEAGNYRKGHVQVGTFDITIEQPEGSVRRGTDAIKEFEEANEHLGDVEQEWEDRILDYVYEHYPTQATVSAETTSPKGIKEREAMKNDPVLKRMRKESDTAFNEADKAVTEAWMRMEAAEAEREKKKSNNLQPIGKGLFGNVYDQFRGKAKEAFAFLREKGSGDALGVFHRNGVGDIDVVWGDKGGGLDHIISKHVGDGKSFLSVDEAAKEIDDIIRTGDKGFENGDKIVFKKGSKLVKIRKNVRENGKKTADKNWVLTAYDELSADGDVSAIAPANQGQAARTTGKSRGKDTKKTGAAQVPASGNDKGLEERREKIDDAGEKIEGARKDAMRKLAESMEQATEEALVAMPFSKAFKRPNLKKAVEDGVLREEDALFAQAVMSAYLSRKKPLLSKSSSSYKRERSERDVRDWARHARKGVELLKKLFGLAPSERDAFMREETSRPAYDQEEVEEHKRQLSEWNPGKVFNGTCYPVNPVKLWLDVYARLGYEAGTDVPQLFSAVEPSGTYGNYRLIAANGNTFYPARKLDTYDAAVNEIVYQTKVANADADTDHPKEAFRVEGTGEAIKEPAGKWRVVTQASLGARPIEYVFNSKEEAEKFAKAYLENDGKKADKYRYASAPAEVIAITGFSEYAVVLRRSDAGSGTHTDFELKRYGTEEEATAAIEVEHDELNGLANKALAKEKEGKGGSSSARKPACSIVSYTEDGKAWKYGIKLSEKYAPKKTALSTMPYYLADGFSTRKEAQEYLDAHIGEYEAKAAEIDEARRNFRYFTGNGERVGNDYRKGEDVTAEQLREQFGFRGVQFGNWTNQRDRQEAVNQAFDAFMDLSRILGVSPKALSLNGELGVAFGARGSGKASAHYEPAQVVINLTKTRGSGALAHEWWHALDNYFARQGNVAKGYVTESKSIGMREELRRAFNALIDHLNKSPYHERSRQRGLSYWGSATEETARMFEQWVNDQLAQRGERSPFLTDADPYAEERYAQDNYELYKRFLGDRAMPYEEFKQTPQALYGFVYLTRDELQAFGKDLKHIFDTIQQKVDETTGKTLMYHKGDVVAPLTSEERVLRDAVIDRLRDGGMEVITDVEEGQRVLDEANGEERMEAKRVSPRRQWLNSYVEAMHLATGRDKKAIRAEVEQKIADIRKETKELYTRVLSGDFNDVTLQLINNYIDSFTPYNEYWRPLSKRLPPKALRSLRKGERTGAVDALFSRICESAVEKNGRAGADGRRKIEEKKEELLKKWAIATGSWHTDVSDFGVDETPIGSGKDSVVYQSGDGKTVVKASRGKFDSRKFPSDIDHVALFNYIFPESRYEILGYGEVGGKFVKFLRQPFVDFSASVPLTAEERTEYMRKLGFEPMNEEKTVFSNSSIVVSDLQKSNIVRDKSGNVRVIDADVKLHTRDIGGNYTYPDVETDTEDPKAIREHRVYHGSGADFDAFDHSHMGEGEGAQAYGWGTYVTEVEGIGRTYAIQNTTKRNDALRALQHDVDSISGNLARHRDGLKYAEEQLKRANEWRAEAELDYELFQEKAEELKREYGETSPEYQNHLFNDIYTDEMKHARRSARDTEESIRYHKEKIAESEKALKDKQAEIDELPEKFPRHLYTVEIPDDNGGNYIDYNGRIAEIPPQKTDAICAELEKLGWKRKDLPSMVRLTDGNDNVVLNPNATGADLYEEIKTALKSAKQASLLLSRAGFAGIKYPADNMRGGRADGAKNYVVFDEKDARIAGHVRFFRTAEGGAYGFTVGGKIYIDPGIANAETPVHEYAHLWASALEAGNPKEWRNVVGLMKGTPVWDEVKRRYPELETDDEIADEVLATYSGRRGAERLREEAKRVADGGGSVFDKAEAVSALGRVREALERFWKAVADFLHIRYTSAEEVADRVMKDLLDGVDPRKFGKENGSVRMSAKKKRAPETVSVSREKKHQPTAVSSADGAKETATIAGNPTNKATGVSDAHAKVQTNLDSLAKSYGKKGTNKTRGFITDLSRALGLEQHEASNYGSFDLPNGNRLAIRVSNHNARVSNFDRNNEDNGISIVISSHRNKGLDNDGTAHLVEFFYNRRSIENAEGKPLAEIVKSIKQALYSGEFKDTTGLAERQEVNAKDAIRFQSVGERAGEAVDVMKFRLLEADDPKAMELEALPDSELVPVYRNVQAFEDDALGSPMAFTDAETGERRTLEGGKWNYSNPPEIHLTDEQQRKLDELNKNGYIMVDGKKATELPINEGLKFVKPKTKEAQLQYFLKKNPEDKGLWAAYDPYDHAIETPLNTQFGEAYKRPNLVVVRSLIPKSEIDEPFHADYALLPTGAHQWNNGRTLYLSRWSKIDKVLTREEEAKMIDEYWKKHPGKREALKTHRDYNRFVPQVRRELEKMGYRFELDGRELTPEESRALDEQNWESRDAIPGREGQLPFIGDEDIARINAKMAGKWVGEPKEAMENAMAARVNELAERLHTPVRIVRTAGEVSALPSARQRRMKGSFNPLTGEVTIVVPNNANMADVENTFVHEVVGHGGLRVLFPEEEKLDSALDELYRVSDGSIREAIDRTAKRMYDAEVDRLREKKRREHEARGEDANASYYADMAEAHAEASKKRGQFRRDATEEYGADLAGRIGEKGFERMGDGELTFWGRLKAMLQKALQKLLDGLGIPGKRKWSDKDWAFVLHEAYKRKKNGGKPTVFDAADTEVMRRKTGFGETKFSEGKVGQKTIVATTIAGMKQRVAELFEKAKTGEFVGKPASIGRLSADGKAYLEKLSGLKFKEFVDFVLNPSDLNHIRSDHYGENEKDKGNNVLLTDEDIQNMVDVLNQPDGILYGVDKKDGRKLFFFLKDAGNGLYNLTEVCSTKKGNLTAKSFFKSKKKGISQRVMEIKDSLLPTSVTYSGEFLSSDAKIPTLFEINESSSENVADEDLMFRDGDSVEYNKAMARDIYERRVRSGMYQTVEALQDSMLGLKEAMEAVLKAEGRGKTYIEDVADYENAYLGENALSSKNKSDAAEFSRTLFKPMLEEAARLAGTADERAELTDYMMAKHGLERNEVMARRAAAKDAAREFYAELRKAERAVAQDPQDQDAADALDDVKRRRHDREEELYLENRGRDYAGLTALTGMDNVMDAETEAQRMVADYEAGHDTRALWYRVNAVNAATLRTTYESGLISKATYDDISGMYAHYIPLRGFDEKTAEEAYAYLSDRHGAFSAPIKAARGRKSKADDPFANMEAMAESAIMQGNRNVLVKQKFLNFALNHPSDLVSVSDLWLWHNDAAGEWQPALPGDVKGTERIGEDDSPAEVERKMRDFEEAMEQAAKSDPDHFRKQKDAPDIPYRVVESRDLRQHQVLVKRGGRDYLLTVNGNPRAAQALNGLTNPDNDISGAIGAVMEGLWRVSRQMSAFYTTRNPDFVVSNFVRDMLYTNTMVWVKESPNYAWRFHRNFAKVNPARMKVLLARLRKGTLDMNDETERMFHLFMMNGGETGYANIRDIDKRKNDIKQELKKYNGQMPVRKAWSLLGERLDEYNRAVENCARFAAFMTSRQMGRTVLRSVYDAKEISVNFNKKGSGAKFMRANGQTKAGYAAAFASGWGRSMYVFWNAAVQGTANFGRQAVRHPAKALGAAASVFLLGQLVAAIGGGDDGDGEGDRDAYWNLPDYVRRNNIVFRLPGMDRSWISLPLPVEYRALYGLGELSVSALSGRRRYTRLELAHEAAGLVSQVFPIDFMEGGDWLSWKAFVPSAVKPVAEVLANESWTGMPIYRETPFNKDDPEWTKAYRSANGYLVAASEWLNEKTGGDRYTSGAVDINPAMVEHLLNGTFGGVSQTIDKLTKTGETVLGDREYDPRSFLLLNRLVKRGDERTEYRAVNDAYFRIKEECEGLRKRLNRYEDDTADGVFDYAERIARINASPEYRALDAYEAWAGDVDAISEELEEAEREGASGREVKSLEAELSQAKAVLVERVNAARDGKR